MAGRVLATGQPVWVLELATEADFQPQAPATACGLRSDFAFPVLIGSEVVAVLEFFSRARTEPTCSFLDVAGSIGIQLGRVAERQRAQQALRESEIQVQEAQQLAQDITDEKWVEAELVASRERYRQMLELTREGVPCV